MVATARFAQITLAQSAKRVSNWTHCRARSQLEQNLDGVVVTVRDGGQGIRWSAESFVAVEDGRHWHRGYARGSRALSGRLDIEANRNCTCVKVALRLTCAFSCS